MLKRRVEQHTGVQGVYQPRHESYRKKAAQKEASLLPRRMSEATLAESRATDLEDSLAAEECLTAFEESEEDDDIGLHAADLGDDDDSDEETQRPVEDFTAEWEAVQRDQAQQLSFSDAPSLGHIRYVGGVDVAFVSGSPYGVASIAVFSYPDMVLETRVSTRFISRIPHLPNFGSFRKVPGIVLAMEDLKRKRPDAVPQVLVVSGSARLHPRGFGLGCHVGLSLGLPTFSISKSLLEIDGLEQEATPWMLSSKPDGGWAELWGTSGTVWGAAVKTLDSQHPAFVSAGHLISLETAADITAKMAAAEPVRRRIPLATRFAEALCRSAAGKHETGLVD
eukprot:TRINITY_DN2240_c1_g1_i1.p1 TRINITY_DN2240_c1_g1~~TRINITY_DN2240_c1_g1_i1.p1  ORF type:complete len:360 (+),score=114.96 TRINITY_DN2240_c1_g1_i1:71-1081(+)